MPHDPLSAYNQAYYNLSRVPLPDPLSVYNQAYTWVWRSEMFGPAEDARRNALVEKLVAKRRAPGEDQEAAMCIGSRANFERPPSVAAAISVNFPEPPDEDEEEPCINPLAYEATTWTSHKIRVENPEDSEQYVMVERLDTVCFKGPDGRQHNFNLEKIWQTIEANAANEANA